LSTRNTLKLFELRFEVRLNSPPSRVKKPLELVDVMEIEEAGATVFPYRLIEPKLKKEPAVVTVPDPAPLPAESPI
jgi:hypothetical protein